MDAVNAQHLLYVMIVNPLTFLTQQQNYVKHVSLLLKVVPIVLMKRNAFLAQMDILKIQQPIYVDLALNNQVVYYVQMRQLVNIVHLLIIWTIHLKNVFNAQV